MLSLETIIKRDNNNFDLIRLIAALAVIFGHSFELFNTYQYYEPVKAILGIDYSGTLAVYVFFFLSGILITSSFFNKKNHFSYIIMRGFRIWPGLIACTFITVFIIGPALTSVLLKEYFHSRLTWSFLFCNSIIYNIKYTLPGVFENNHYKGAVNGSLWTLPLEIFCYAVVFIIGSAISAKKTILKVCLFALIIGAYFMNSHYWLGYFLNKPVLFFAAGSLSYAFRKYIFINGKLSIVLFILCCLFYSKPYFIYLFYVCFVYGMLALSSADFFKKLKLPGDYSYGIYIYSFLVQQIFSHFLPNINPYESLIVTIPVIMILAYLSWHMVESPFLKLGRSLSAKISEKKVPLAI